MFTWLFHDSLSFAYNLARIFGYNCHSDTGVVSWSDWTARTTTHTRTRTHINCSEIFVYHVTAVSLCLSVCLYVSNTKTFESLDLDSSFLVCRHISGCITAVRRMLELRRSLRFTRVTYMWRGRRIGCSRDAAKQHWLIYRPDLCQFVEPWA